MGRDALVYQDDLDSFTLDLHDYIQRHPLVYTEEGFDNLAEYVEQYFDKHFSNIYTGDYRNYN